MKRIFIVLLLVLMGLACNSEKSITVFMVGDSTMANKKNTDINPERGWGQLLPTFFNDNVTIRNLAQNGRSSKSFISEGRWDTVMTDIKPGDYVFIQFGHNDQKYKSPERFTNPYTGYRQNLEKFVNETRAKGGIPVLFTSTIRRKFNEWGVLEDTHGEYPFVVRDVARDLKVPFVDMQRKTENLVLELGIEKSKELFMWLEPGECEMYPDGREDNTHFTEHGAIEMCKLAIEGLKENDLALVRYLK